METFTIENLTFSYPDRDNAALNDITLSLKQGEFITLCGKSGCGKSTLLRHLKTVLTPHGKRSGSILFEGKALAEIDHKTQSSKIGYVLQSPDNQIVTDKVWHELAFGLESLGLDNPTIRLRVAEMASFFGIQTWFHKSITELSGGQKQLLNLASIMAMHPSVLILDEPTSQLDPIAASDFLQTIGKINRELGTTIIISEHRLDEVLPLTDTLIAIDNGKILAIGNPKEVGAKLKEKKHGIFLSMPVPMRIYSCVESKLACPLTIREGREWLDKLAETQVIDTSPIKPCNTGTKKDDYSVEISEAWFKYEKSAPDVVKGLSMRIHKGEFYAIVGGNGTGKTTTLSLINGINKAYRGKIVVSGKIATLPQNPQALFVKKTVETDLMEMFSGSKLPKDEQKQKIADMAKLCQIENLLANHPYDLSGGEQQRAALAKVLLLEPDILLLDEPTKGLDGSFKLTLAGILKNLQKNGTTIVMVSHDIEFCAAFPDRCAMFFDGNISAEGIPQTFFSGNSFYTSAANRMARHMLPLAVTVFDVVSACGGTPERHFAEKEIPEKNNHSNAAGGNHAKKNTPNESVSGVRKLPKRTLLAALIIVLFIPLTIWFGIRYLEDRKYYIISMLIIIETMLPFILIFEGRRPQARETVIIAVLCAITVAGRSAFFMVPQFKPVVAMVIISGVCFGGEAGFLVGAMSAFLSNFFFGQGPWTPWQMFALGIIGFLAGILFHKGFLRRNTVSLCIFGGLATFFIYGGLMNPLSVLMYQTIPTAEMFITAYALGLPFDLIHASSTVIFLAVISRPMIEKLDRVKTKYGLISVY